MSDETIETAKRMLRERYVMASIRKNRWNLLFEGLVILVIAALLILPRLS